MAGIRDYKKVASTTEDVSRLQDKLQEFFQPIVANPLLDGALLTGVKLTTAVSQVPHGLGRPPLGYIVTAQNANATVWRPSNSLPSTFLDLQASAAVTVDLWVF